MGHGGSRWVTVGRGVSRAVAWIRAAVSHAEMPPYASKKFNDARRRSLKHTLWMPPPVKRRRGVRADTGMCGGVRWRGRLAGASNTYKRTPAGLVPATFPPAVYLTGCTTNARNKDLDRVNDFSCYLLIVFEFELIRRQ